ncbi:DMT family transporter [Sutterella sp.]|uniref:DMT family transporter n=1 Tax=Sutterella sp. TaxID=1981025 RepID=UPI0025DAF4E5|nr:DMT family transporter [uncultured Sutterella sp.]
MTQPMLLERTRSALPFLALVAATAFWGSSFITVAEALHSTDPFTLVFLRFGAGTLLVLALLRGQVLRIPARTWRMGAVCATVIYASYLLNHAGLMTILSSTSGFLTALYVPITPFLFWAMAGRRPDGFAFAGALTAFAGLALLADPFSLSFRSSWGEWATIASAFLSAFEIILMGRFAPYCRAREIAFVQILFVTLFAGAGTLLAHAAGLPLEPTTFTPELVLSVGWLAVILCCAQLLLAWGQKFVPPAQAAVIFALESVFAALIGWFAGERLGFWGVTGGALIVAGILITEAKRIRAEAAKH